MALLVLAKAPEPGRVKTRLCPPASPVQAARIAAAALLDTLDAIRAVPGAQAVVALSGDLANAEMREELTVALRDVPLIPQRGAGLGERIAASHADTAELLPGSDIIQIGMDTPQVGAELLGSCVRQLRSAGTDAVLGPATDGGWWALGLRDPLAAVVVAGVPTSSADTGERTMAALRRNGLHVNRLPQLSDVDTMEDALMVAGSMPGSRFATAVRELL